MRHSTAVCVLLFVFTAAIHAENKTKVAFVEFQNKAGTIIQTNRWTLADDLAKRLRKKNKKVETLSHKEITKHLKELEWEEDRLTRGQERILSELGAKYLVYSDIVHWRIHGQYSNTEVQDASEAQVIFAIRVIDLTTGEMLRLFRADGGATGETGHIVEGDPASFTEEDDSDLQMYDATEVALIKAGDILAEIIAQ